jgi:hypothetical protein
MRHRLAILTLTLAAAATPALAATPTSTVRFTTPRTGVSCVMTTASVSCQGTSSAFTMSGTVTPAGQVTTCRKPQGASPSCVLFPGASYKDVFMANPEPVVGPFACIPMGLFTQPTGAVCTAVASGKGFRMTATKVSQVRQISRGPHPPCTRAAITAGLTRGLHRRRLAPSYLTRGWQCVGNYARADYVVVAGPAKNDTVVVFRGKGRQWQLVSRGGKICTDGELPAQIYIACTVD